MKKIIITAFVLIFTIALVSCSNTKNIQFEVKTLHFDAEKRFRVGAAESWKSLSGQLSDKAAIEIGDTQTEKYFILIADEKSRSGFELAEYAELVGEEFSSKLGEKPVAQFKKKTVAKKQALQAQITSSTDEGKITYILTIFEDSDFYIITCGWYRTEMKNLVHSDVMSVIGSYKSLQAAASSDDFFTQ